MAKNMRPRPPVVCLNAPADRRAIRFSVIGGELHHFGVFFHSPEFDIDSLDLDDNYSSDGQMWPNRSTGLALLVVPYVDGAKVGEFRFREQAPDAHDEALLDMYEDVILAAQSDESEFVRFGAEFHRLQRASERTLNQWLEQGRAFDAESARLSIPGHAAGLAFMRWAVEQGHRVKIGDRDMAICSQLAWEPAELPAKPTDVFAALYAPEFTIDVAKYKSDLKKANARVEAFLRSRQLEEEREQALRERAALPILSLEERVLAIVARVLAERDVQVPTPLLRGFYLRDDLRMSEEDVRTLLDQVAIAFGVEIVDSQRSAMLNIGDVIRFMERHR